MSYIFEHTALGFCWWDIPALIVLIAVAAYFAVRYCKMKNEQKELEDQLSDRYADATIKAGKKS